MYCFMTYEYNWCHLSLSDDPYLEILYREAWHVNDGRDYHRMWVETTPEHVYFSVLDMIDSSTSEMVDLCLIYY